MPAHTLLQWQTEPRAEAVNVKVSVINRSKTLQQFSEYVFSKTSDAEATDNAFIHHVFILHNNPRV